MKRYLFLKLGLTILVFAAASPRSQVPENTASTRDENRRSNVNQNGPQSAAPIDQRGGEIKPNTKEYQGVMGKPGVDFPVLTYIPRTKFTCRSKKSGYYADLETNCQVFHICDEGRKVSFLCPNGTIFQQSDLICDWWFKVDCASSPNLYDESAEQLHEENLKRKENRRVQQQERRTKLQNQQNSKNINNIQPLPNTEQLNVRPPQSVPQFSNVRSGTNPTENYNNVRPENRQGREYVKVRKVVTNQRNHQNYSKKDINHYTEQYQHQRSFDLKETQEPSETASFVNNRYNSETQKNYYNYNDVREKTTYTSPKYYDATERSRGTKTYTQKNVAESIKTTTQHTIYSPTVPPFTARHTTRTPTTVPLTQSRVIASKNKGFYITKDYSTTPRSYQQSIFPKLIIDSLHTTPAAVHPTYRPLVASEIIAGSREIQETDETGSFVTTTESGRTTKQLVYTTLAPREEKIRTATPSVPTPFKLSQYTYLPKSTDSTPIPTIPTEYTTLSPVTDNLNNMIKTLQELDSNIPEVEQNLGSRPGLNIPPSAGPKTLHSLAIYFATAIDNLVTNNTTEDTTPSPDNDNAKVTLLSRTTQEKYNSLFSPEKAGNETIEREDKSIDLKDLVELDASNNDLDGQQSRGLVNSTPRIRQLAQVFTQALSAYLDDPDTFKKVLEEIRPTEPPLTVDVTTPTSTEYRSYTKEEDEVLDFSDVDKSTYKPTRNDITTPRPTPNSLALDLNNRLKISTTIPDDEDITEDYFPASENLDDINLKATAKPYGFGVKPENSTPISVPQIPATGFGNYYQQPSDSLLPPFKISLLDPETNSSFTTNEESLQSAYSQSFISHSNSVNDRTGKSFKVDITTTEFPTTYDYTSTPETTTTVEPTTYRPRQSQTELNRQYYDAVPIYNRNRIETTTNFETTTRQYETTTTDRNLDTTTSRHRYETTTDRNPDTTTNRYDTTTRNFYTTTDRNPYTTTNRYEASTRYPETTTNRYETTTYNAPTTVLPNRKGKSRNRFETTTDYTTTDLYKNRYETTTNRNYETTNFYQKTTDFNKYDSTTDFSRTTTDYQKTTDATTEYYNHKYETTTDSTPYPTEPTTTKPVPDNHWSTSPEVTKLWESTLYLDPLLINQNLESRFGKSLSLETDSPTTDHTTTEYNNEDVVDIRFTTEDYRTTTNPPYSTVIDLGIHNLLNSTELEIASSQAKQIFGNLDIAEQDLLIEKMKEAESNSTVRRLILLLVSTCDASLSNNKTVQETRNSILNALLNLPNEDNHRFGRKYEETTTIEYSTTTTLPETSTLPLQQNLAIVNNTLDIKDVHQDTRALELLRSLYSLAAKWGKK